eukprot:184185-Pleurochrysis_carterae.AAC.1
MDRPGGCTSRTPSLTLRLMFSVGFSMAHPICLRSLIWRGDGDSLFAVFVLHVCARVAGGWRGDSYHLHQPLLARQAEPARRRPRALLRRRAHAHARNRRGEATARAK